MCNLCTDHLQSLHALLGTSQHRINGRYLLHTMQCVCEIRRRNCRSTLWAVWAMVISHSVRAHYYECCWPNTAGAYRVCELLSQAQHISLRGRKQPTTSLCEAAPSIHFSPPDPTDACKHMLSNRQHSAPAAPTLLARTWLLSRKGSTSRSLKTLSSKNSPNWVQTQVTTGGEHLSYPTNKAPAE